ncbi:MAG TPA: HAD-IA family hydrolase [Candidatus Saccharimonadales bacterium]
MAAIIFDFDGTIADSFETVVGIFHELTGRHDPLPQDEIERLRGLSLLHAAEELHVHLWKMPFLLMRGRRRMTQSMSVIQPYPEVPAVIRKLYDEGHQLFIVSSNSTKNIQQFLRQHYMGREFVSVYGGVGLLGKARMLKRVLRRNKLDPKTVWYVGDEVRDITGAREAGLRVAAVTWGYNNAKILSEHQPTRLIKSPDELLKLLQ